MSDYKPLPLRVLLRHERELFSRWHDPRPFTIDRREIWFGQWSPA